MFQLCGMNIRPKCWAIALFLKWSCTVSSRLPQQGLSGMLHASLLRIMPFIGEQSAETLQGNQTCTMLWGPQVVPMLPVSSFVEPLRTREAARTAIAESCCCVTWCALFQSKRVAIIC